MHATHASKLTGFEAADLEEAARTVLDDNWLGASTVPSPGLYPHQWSWDSAFVAIGRSWYDQQRAQTELETLFDAQWANGMLPHIVFNPAVPPGSYFPGPDFWQSNRASGAPQGIATSGITQPPLHAAAALEVYRHAADPPQALAFLERLYPRLAAQHAYLRRWRDPDRRGLAALVHPWESGLDNSSAWDRVLADLQITSGALLSYQRRDLAHADPADRPTDAAYDRFVYLAARYRDAGYDDTTLLTRSPFLIQGPLFNAIWRWSAQALAEIAALVGDDPAPHQADARRIRQAIVGQLWDPAGRRFGTRDVRAARRTPEDTILAFTPLLDPQLPRPMVTAITELLGSPCFHPAEAAGHYLVPTYDLCARVRPAPLLARAGVDQYRLAAVARPAPARRGRPGRRAARRHARAGPQVRVPRVLPPPRRPGLRRQPLQLDRRAGHRRAPPRPPAGPRPAGHDQGHGPHPQMRTRGAAQRWTQRLSAT
jgi:hypothetical protein